MVIGIAAALLALAGLYFYLDWPQYKFNRALKDFTKTLERSYQEDIHGGKTPEETFDMLLIALKQGDLDLASKYFRLNKQAEYHGKFEKMRSEGTLEKQIQEWERARNEWEKDADGSWRTHVTMKYKYIQKAVLRTTDAFGNELTFQPGEYTSEIIFDLNELSNVWKITLL